MFSTADSHNLFSTIRKASSSTDLKEDDAFSFYVPGRFIIED